MEGKFNYLTEQDLITRYAKKRGIDREDIEDLYNAFRKWIIYKLNDTSLTSETGYYFKNFMLFSHKYLALDDLKKGKDNPRYKRAQEQLLYYLSGRQRLKIK